MSWTSCSKQSLNIQCTGKYLFKSLKTLEAGSIRHNAKDLWDVLVTIVITSVTDPFNGLHESKHTLAMTCQNQLDFWNSKVKDDKPTLHLSQWWGKQWAFSPALPPPPPPPPPVYQPTQGRPWRSIKSSWLRDLRAVKRNWRAITNSFNHWVFVDWVCIASSFLTFEMTT